MTTIQNAIDQYLDSVSMARSKNTSDTYGYALHAFSAVLEERNLPPATTPISDLSEDAIAWLATHLKAYTASTEGLYIQAVKGFYEFLSAEGLASPNLPRIRLLVRQRTRRPGQRLPQFPREEIERVIDYAQNLGEVSGNQGSGNQEIGNQELGSQREPKLGKGAEQDAAAKLINLRDRAFLLTLADTGLRVHEACGLHRGDMDWNEGRAVVIGKGNRQAVVRFSNRSIHALKDYLAARAALDGSSGKPLPSLPLFARHDRGAGKKVKPVTTATGRNIVTQRVREAIGESEAGKITPHSFRHYFVTTVLRSSGNLKLAQELARHKNIAVTTRYAHLSDDELDKGYWEVFEGDL